MRYMETWEESRIARLEDRIDRLERKEWERRDYIFRLIMHGLTATMVLLSIASIALSIIHATH
jgi:NADPH-dependent curcumin reductase CurA